MQGRSVSDFVVAAAQEAAQNAIEKTQIVRLAAEDQRRFAEALLKPQPLEPAMDRARDAYAQLVQG